MEAKTTTKSLETKSSEHSELPVSAEYAEEPQTPDKALPSDKKATQKQPEQGKHTPHVKPEIKDPLLFTGLGTSRYENFPVAARKFLKFGLPINRIDNTPSGGQWNNLINAALPAMADKGEFSVTCESSDNDPRVIWNGNDGTVTDADGKNTAYFKETLTEVLPNNTLPPPGDFVVVANDITFPDNPNYQTYFTFNGDATLTITGKIIEPEPFNRVAEINSVVVSSCSYVSDLAPTPAKPIDYASHDLISYDPVSENNFEFNTDLRDFFERAVSILLSDEYFTRYEAYNVSKLLMELSNVGNYLKDSIICAAYYNPDPARNANPTAAEVGRFEHCKFFKSGTELFWEIPVSNLDFYTKKGSEPRLYSPGYIGMVPFINSTSTANFEMTITAEIQFKAPSSLKNSTQAGFWREVDLAMPPGDYEVILDNPQAVPKIAFGEIDVPDQEAVFANKPSVMFQRDGLVFSVEPSELTIQEKKLVYHFESLRAYNFNFLPDFEGSDFITVVNSNSRVNKIYLSSANFNKYNRC